jgi:hypothetical protein
VLVRVVVGHEEVVPRAGDAGADIVVTRRLDAHALGRVLPQVVERLGLRVDDARGRQDVVLVHGEGARGDALRGLLDLLEGVVDASAYVAGEIHPVRSPLIVTVPSLSAGYQWRVATT